MIQEGMDGEVLCLHFSKVIIGRNVQENFVFSRWVEIVAVKRSEMVVVNPCL